MVEGKEDRVRWMKERRVRLGTRELETQSLRRGRSWCLVQPRR